MFNSVEQWGIFELALDGPSEGNPFLDVNLSAEFRQQNRVLEPDGFYDGDGVYRIRFMPDAPGEWTYVTRSNMAALEGHTGAFFRHFEQRVSDLLELGIEADIIVFHPYDRWGYCEMDAESDYRYLRYLVARLAAYRNIWWSMANEYDFLLDTKPMSQWDRYFKIVQQKDPYQHLRSIHNGNMALCVQTRSQ